MEIERSLHYCVVFDENVMKLHTQGKILLFLLCKSIYETGDFFLHRYFSTQNFIS